MTILNDSKYNSVVLLNLIGILVVVGLVIYNTARS